MIVSSRNIEFGYELLSAIPYAYGLHLEGKLTGTVSGVMSEPLYYFSPDHRINKEQRSYFNVYKAGLKDRKNGYPPLPWLSIHREDQPKKSFPPYREIYANKTYKWKRPTLCICNRANIEWKHSMINYFDAEILDWLFENLKSKYEIIYMPVQIPAEIQDHEKPIEIGDVDVAQKHGVRIFTDLVKNKNWNDVLLRVFANCEHYITMNGGYSILASYFSGTNIIYSKPGQTQAYELNTYEFWRWYPNINNVRTLHVPSYDKLKERVKTLYIDEAPTANVIIRTSKRPNFFRSCIKRVLDQDYPNINIVVVCDSKQSLPYTYGYNIRVIEPESIDRPTKPNGEQYGVYFPANDYIRQALEKISGYVFIMDDDDMYIDRSAISKVMEKARADSLMVWRVRFPDKLIPGDSFGDKPTLYDIDSNGMCWHTSHPSDWSPWKRADYRTAAMFNKIVWVDEVLTAVQEAPGMGKQNDKKEIKMSNNGKQPFEVEIMRDYKTYKNGDRVLVSWIEGMYLQRRGIAVVFDQAEIKEEKPVYEDKELKPKRTRKKLKDESN